MLGFNSIKLKKSKVIDKISAQPLFVVVLLEVVSKKGETLNFSAFRVSLREQLSWHATF